MFNLVPVNMFEIQQKLDWSLENNIKADQESIIKDALKENVQNMVNDVLEGPIGWLNGMIINSKFLIFQEFLLIL